MEFKDKLIVDSFNQETGYRLIRWININENVDLSVQASYGHYCNPRKTVDLDQYESMEFAILYDGDFVEASSVINNEELIAQLEDYYDGTVYGYVPIELIEELHIELIKQNN